eukprot:753268-Hanusia_phi.AAC.1
MLQVRVAQLCGSELDGLTVSQLEELERMQAEALRRCGVAKYVRLRQEFQEKEEHMREDVEKMRREFEERMDKMKVEVQKIQEEKVLLLLTRALCSSDVCAGPPHGPRAASASGVPDSGAGGADVQRGAQDPPRDPTGRVCPAAVYPAQGEAISCGVRAPSHGRHVRLFVKHCGDGAELGRLEAEGSSSLSYLMYVVVC